MRTRRCLPGLCGFGMPRRVGLRILFGGCGGELGWAHGCGLGEQVGDPRLGPLTQQQSPARRSPTNSPQSSTKHATDATLSGAEQRDSSKRGSDEAGAVHLPLAPCSLSTCARRIVRFNASGAMVVGHDGVPGLRTRTFNSVRTTKQPAHEATSSRWKAARTSALRSRFVACAKRTRRIPACDPGTKVRVSEKPRS